VIWTVESSVGKAQGFVEYVKGYDSLAHLGSSTRPEPGLAISQAVIFVILAALQQSSRDYRLPRHGPKLHGQAR
jgi:hypothetical protein